jgi:hypothetical protein
LEDILKMVLKKINDWENISVLQRGRLPERAYFLSFSNDNDALTYERGNSQGVKPLNGKWNFIIQNYWVVPFINKTVRKNKAKATA